MRRGQERREAGEKRERGEREGKEKGRGEREKGRRKGEGEGKRRGRNGEREGRESIRLSQNLARCWGRRFDVSQATSLLHGSRSFAITHWVTMTSDLQATL